MMEHINSLPYTRTYPDFQPEAAAEPQLGQGRPDVNIIDAESLTSIMNYCLFYVGDPPAS